MAKAELVLQAPKCPNSWFSDYETSVAWLFRVGLEPKLRSTTSLWALGAAALLGFSAPRLAAAACAVDVVGNPSSGPVSNSAAINCIAIDNSTVNGNVTNTPAGTINANGTSGVSGTGINLINNSTITGTIVNNGSITANTNGIGVASGTISGGISNSGTIRAGFDGIATGNPTFFGGITNSGTITAGSIGIVSFDSSTFSGGITNGGDISANSTSIRVNHVTAFSGGISNSGMLSVGNKGVFVENTSKFTGGISNSGTIAAGAVGIGVSNDLSFAGDIANSGSISAAATGIYVNAVTTFAGNISNSGTITGATGVKIDSGVTFAAGDGIINTGTITGTAGTAIDLTSATSPVTINQLGGTISGAIKLSANADTLDIGGGVINGNIVGQGTSDTVTFAPGAGTFTYSNTLSGVNNINVNSGTMVLNGTIGNGGAGAPTILTIASAGTLLIGSNAAVVVPGLIDNGTFGFAQSGAYTFANAISGGGVVEQLGLGTTTLTGNNLYTGATNINAGTLALGLGGSIAASSGVNLAESGVVFDISGGGNQTIKDLSGVAGSRVSLGANTLTFGTNNSTIFAGSFAGAGGLVWQGTGTLALTGNSSAFTGATNINAGTLALGPGGSIAASSGVNLAESGVVFDISGGGNQTIKDLSGVAGSRVSLGANTLTFGTNNSTIFAGSFAGAGGLVWQGTGTLALTGNSSAFTGATTINSGTIALGIDSAPNASLSGNVNVVGGTLKGFGTIGGNLANIAGSVAPGGSIGVLTVNGNYRQASGATLSIEVSPTAASQLKVGGAARLNGTLALNFDPGVYSPIAYKILTASTVNGTFSTVTGVNPSGLAQSILYDPADVTLQLSSSGPTVVAPTNDTIYTAVTSVAVLNAQQLNGIILDRIGQRRAGIADGEVAAAVPSSFPGGFPGAQLAQAGNAAEISGFASALPQVLAAQGAWFRGIGSFASVNGNSSAPGFVGSAGGFMAGYDRPISSNAYLGVAGGYLHSNIDEHSTSSGTEESARFVLYGGGWAGANLFTATAGYAHDWFKTSRGIAGIGTASENHGGDEASVAGQWSLPLTIAGFGGGSARLTPKAGIQYVHLSERGLGEIGASGFDLSSGSHSTDSLQPYIQAVLSQAFITDRGVEVAPEVRFGYAHDVFNSRVLTITTASGAAFPVTGVAPSRDQVSAGFGVVMQAAPNFSLYANYDTILHTGNTTEQTVQAGFRWKF